MFHQKLLGEEEKKVSCFYCFEDNKDEKMYSRNLQRHCDRRHDNKRKRVATEEYMAEMRKKQEQDRIDEEISNLQAIRDAAKSKEHEEKLAAEQLEQEKITKLQNDKKERDEKEANEKSKKAMIEKETFENAEREKVRLEALKKAEEDKQKQEILRATEEAQAIANTLSISEEQRNISVVDESENETPLSPTSCSINSDTAKVQRSTDELTSNENQYWNPKTPVKECEVGCTAEKSADTIANVDYQSQLSRADDCATHAIASQYKNTNKFFNSDVSTIIAFTANLEYTDQSDLELRGICHELQNILSPTSDTVENNTKTMQRIECQESDPVELQNALNEINNLIDLQDQNELRDIRSPYVSHDELLVDLESENEVQINEMNALKHTTSRLPQLVLDDFVTKQDLNAWGVKIIAEVHHTLKPNTQPREQEPQCSLNIYTPENRKDQISLIRSSKSVEDILRHADDFELTENYLVCKPCRSHNQDNPQNKRGLFKCDFTNHANYDNTKQPKGFTNLKTRVIEHLDTKGHTGSKNFQEINNTLDQEELDQNYTAGMNVARTAYKCIKLHDNNAQFESEIQINSAMNLPVGELNHSANFAADMTGHFHSTLQEQHQEVLKTPLKGTNQVPPFSIVSDKGTPNRRPLHIIGLISQMNGKLEPTVLDIVKAKDGTGKGLATDIHTAMNLYYSDDEIRKNFVSMSFDGQYFHCDVPNHLMNLLDVPQENRSFYAAQYDIGHLIELADKDTKLKSDWVEDTYSVITGLNQKYGYGKQFMELEDRVDNFNNEKDAEEDKLKLKRFKPFSTTRFATYTAGVIEAVRNNYGVIYNSLHDNQDPLLNKISNADFVLQLNGLRDVYTTIGETSRSVQKPDVYSWNIDETVASCSTNLSGMVESLNKDQFEASNPKLKFYNQSVRELREEGTYQGKPLTINKQGLKELRPRNKEAEVEDATIETRINVVGNKIAKHIETFKTNFENRYAKHKAPMCKVDQNCFSLKDVSSRLVECIPLKFKKCVDISQRTKYIPDTLTLDELQKEYTNFSKTVHNKVEKWKASYLDLPINEQKLYDQLLNSPSELVGCRNVGHLLAAATTRTHCEAITESMGSVVSKQVHDRKSLTVQTLAKETFICWNGPFPGKSADPLLERSLDKNFGSRQGWHFYRKTKRADKLKDFNGKSKVIARTPKEGRVPFKNN